MAWLLRRRNTECTELQGQLSAAMQTVEEHESEMEVYKTRDGEMLSLTQKMTERNAELQSENSALKSKVCLIPAWFSKLARSISNNK